MAKNKTNITSHTKDINLKCELVRILACRMAYITKGTFGQVYENSGYYKSDALNDLRALTTQRILLEDKNMWVVKTDSFLSYRNMERPFYVNPEYVPDILSSGSLQDVSNAIYRAKITADIQFDQDGDHPFPASFVEALALFLRGKEEYKDKLKESSGVFDHARNHNRSYIHRLLTWMLRQPRFQEFFSNCTNRDKITLCSMLADEYADMDKLDYAGVTHYLFFDETGEARDTLNSIFYVLHNELFVHGQIVKLIQKYENAPRVAEYLEAVAALHSGNLKPIIDVTLELAEVYTFEILSRPGLAMYFAAALLADKSPESMAMAKKMQRNGQIKGIASLFHALMDWKTKGAVSAKRIEEVACSAYNPSSMIVFSLFALHYQMFDRERDWPNFMRYYIEEMSGNSRMQYIRMLFSEACKDMAPLSDYLHDTTEMKSFLNFGEVKERWQKVLEQLQIKYGIAKDRNAGAMQSGSRVAYLVNPVSLSVQPVVQKSSDGVKWTKGRNIALSTFRTGKAEGMTQQDKAVSQCVKISERGWYGGVDYYIDSQKAIKELAGHPYVFTNDDNRLKIEITEEPLQLSVQRDGNGQFHIKANIELDRVDGTLYIDRSNATSLRVVKIDSSQASILRQLLDLGALPAKAEKELANTLNAIGSKMTVMSDLMGQDKNVRQIEGSPMIVVQLLPDGDVIRATLFTKPLVNSAPYLTPGKGSEYVSGRENGQVVQAKRNFAAEKENLEKVYEAMKPYDDAAFDDNVWMLDIEQTLGLLDSLVALKEEAYVEWPEGTKMRISRAQLQPGAFHFSVKKTENWFAVEGEVEIDENTRLKVADLLRQLGSGNSRFVRLGDNEYVALSQQLAKLLRNISQLANEKGKKMQVSAFNASIFDELEKAGVELKSDKAYRDMLKRIEEADKAVIKTPRGLQADLRDYQKEGYRWMARLNLWGAGACLADDMGLGKTLQTIALLYAQRAKGPSLVVAPTSILLNWQDEIARFAPQLTTKLLNPVADVQRSEIIEQAKAGDVVITSYGLLITKQEMLAAKDWNIIVLDEAHTIKNRDTKMSKAAMALKGDMRVALTGTPLQNRLAEIWNIFQFINPGLLGSFQAFTEKFINPIEKDGNKERQRLLKRMISPFMLRRTKSDVLSELPEKTEIQIKVNLTDEERALYESIRSQAELAVASGQQSPIEALAEITKLRQAACNPRLINQNITIESSKAAAFMELVENLHSNHHRALVFSQFTSHLALIREQLDAAGYNYLYLDGSTPGAQRAKLVEEFQTGDVPLFLISLKAGGLGLNLTAADYVIHLDPWWNPAIEDQASDRSHRIGQQKPVTVYRLIAADTIEDKILRLHAHKKSLADALLEGADMSARLTKEEILSLLNQNM